MRLFQLIFNFLLKGTMQVYTQQNVCLGYRIISKESKEIIRVILSYIADTLIRFQAIFKKSFPRDLFDSLLKKNHADFYLIDCVTML